MHIRLYRSPSKLHFWDRSLQWGNLWVTNLILYPFILKYNLKTWNIHEVWSVTNFWSSYFQVRRNFLPGVPGRLVIGLVEVGREQEHEHVSNIVSISFQVIQKKLEPVTKTNVSLRLSMGKDFHNFLWPAGVILNHGRWSPSEALNIFRPAGIFGLAFLVGLW